MDTGIVTHIVVGGGKIDWGLGVYGALDFAPTASGRGFRAVAQVRHDWLNGGFRDGFGFITVEVTRSQVSLGYYW